MKLSASEFRSHLSWIAAICVAAVASAIAVAARGNPSVVDYLLPLVTATVGILGWRCRARAGSELIASAMAIIPVAALVPDSELRHAAYGILFAGALATATIALQVRGRLKLSDAMFMAVGVLVPFRLFFAASAGDVLAGVLIIASVVGLIDVLATSRSVGLNRLMMAVAIGMATPLQPGRVVLFPLVVLLLVLALRTRIPAVWVIDLLVAAVAGRWALALVIVPMLASLIPTRDKAMEPLAALGPPLLFSLTPLLRVLVVDPFAWFRGQRRTDLLPAIALLIAGLFLRPPLTVLFTLVALIVIVATENEELPSISLSVIVALGALLLPWAGALPPTWPLPLPLISLAAIAIPSLATASWRWRASGAVIALGFIVALAVTTPWRVPEDAPVGLALGPGQSVNINPERETKSLDLLLSGANITALPKGTSFASLDIIDARGKAYRREVTVGDVSDWAALRGDQFFRSRHGSPQRPAGHIKDLGAHAFLESSGAVRLTLSEPIKAIRVVADPRLPAPARVQIDAFRFGAW